jgi:hypothetical protein
MKMGARMEEVCRFAGSHDAGAGAPLEIAASVPDFSRITFRVQRRQRFKAKTAFRVASLKRQRSR